MVYTDVINQGLHLILPKKQKYTLRDVNKIYSELFLKGDEISDKKARFITISTAIFHDAECSKNVYKIKGD